MLSCRSLVILALAIVLGGCAGSGVPCVCNLLGGDVAEAGPPLEPQVAWAPAPPVSAPPPAEPSRRIVLRGVNFGFDSDAIRGEDQAVLDAAIEALTGSPGVRVEVAGHSDSVGPEVYNQGLSERRAQGVRNYLVKGGVSASQIDAIGMGQSHPVADNGSRDGRAQNRRVELNIRE
jgi:OOP family OmpA-OmpF porin